MYCPSCGNEISDEISFCNFCGANVKPQATPEAPVYYEAQQNNTAPNYAYAPVLNQTGFFASLGDKKIWLIITMVSLILNPIFGAFEILKASASFLGVSSSQGLTLFQFLELLAEDLPFIGFLTFVGIASIIIAEVLLVLPLLKKTTYKAKSVTLTKVIAIIAALFIAFVYIMIFAEASDRSYVSVSITFGGFLLIIDTIALIVASFKFSKMLKKEAKLNRL